MLERSETYVSEAAEVIVMDLLKFVASLVAVG